MRVGLPQSDPERKGVINVGKPAACLARPYKKQCAREREKTIDVNCCARARARRSKLRFTT